MPGNFSIQKCSGKARSSLIALRPDRNRASGMIAMDDAIIEAYKQDKITKETAIMYASDARYVASKM